MNSRQLPLGLSILLVVIAALPVRAQFAELTKKIPGSANVAAFVNVDKLMSSPAAMKNGWSEKRDKAFASGVSFLPPDAKYAVLAMELDVQMWTPMWEAAVLELDHNPDTKKIAEMTGGAVDTIEGLSVVDLPSDAYLVKFNGNTGAFMAPANRQSVARWLRQVQAKNDLNVSGYLFEAYKYANDRGTPVILALDLEDAFPPGAIQSQLMSPDAADFLKKNNIPLDKAVKLCSNVRGITLGITFADQPYGKVKIDFKDDVAMTPEMAKLAMLHVFSTHGVMLNEFYEWKPEVEGRSIALEGYFTPSGMRRVGSLFNRPPALKMPASASDVVPKTKQELMRDASVNYFHHIEGYLKDFQEVKTGAQSMGSYGVWMNKYAGKIDQLSALNVDPDLLNYGAYVSDTLRQSYNAIRTGAARSRIREVNTPMQYDYYTNTNTWGYTYRDGWYGGGVVPWGNTYTTAVPDQQAYIHARTAVKTEERVESGTQARTIFQGIEKATGDIRRSMTTKYMVDF
ncbi:hypothetical protein [Anatilimnocola floriformis]|uniref:hypothetical protein n=1 Tax=Anatilimnocola floriformis TaxID=2948575 RepID=UPI0020C26BB6|nr:hypothetical protein [Anatilimnocola floriformis]